MPLTNPSPPRYDEAVMLPSGSMGMVPFCRDGNGRLRPISPSYPMQSALGANDAGLAAVIAALGTAGHADLALLLAKLSSDPATQTTLAAVLAKISADPSTATNQATLNTAIATLLAQTDQLEGYAAAGNAKLDTLHADLTPIAAGRWATATLNSVGVPSAAFDCTAYGLTRCAMQVNRNGATGVQIGLQASLDSSSPTHWFEIARDAKANADSAITTVEMPVRWLRVNLIAVATGSGIQVSFGGFP